MEENCLLCENIDPANKHYTFIKAYEYWTILANFKQPLLGSSLIVLNRHATRLGELTPEEHLSYIQISSDLYHALEKAFKPDLENLLKLANTINHWHVHYFPRYADDRGFDGRLWQDDNYGGSPESKKENLHTEESEKDKETLKAIINEIVEHL